MPLLIATWSRFPLTPLLYVLIFVHALILMLGGHYTYAEVPVGFWVQDLFELQRNHYDRIVHFRDIAEVRRTYKDAESYARLNGKPAIAIEVVQRGGANLLQAIDDVMAIVEREQQYWPPEIDVSVSKNKSKDVNNMLTELQNSVIAAVLLGPWWAVLTAMVIAILRNAMGVGTLLAFPGGMIGAFLAGLAFRVMRRTWAAAFGEIVGTGAIAPVVSALFVAPILMGKAIPLLALAPSFVCSTVAGALLGVLALRLLKRTDIVDY